MITVEGTGAQSVEVGDFFAIIIIIMSVHLHDATDLGRDSRR